MDDYKLLRFIKGTLSDKEAKEIIAWIEHSDANRKHFNGIKNTFALLPPKEYMGKLDDSESLRKGTYITGQKRNSIGLLSILKYAAAITLIVAASFFTYFKGKTSVSGELETAYHTISAPPGQTSEVTFPDGSIAILNSASTLTYPASYSVDKRSIKLEGEAMFDVQSNPERPFTVEARGILVKATGTSFNVDAYASDEEINITLVEGKVDLFNSKGCLVSKLDPGENARIDLAANKLYISEVDTDYYLSWRKGIIMFTNRSLGDIAQELERWYNVSIVFSDAGMKDIKYSGAILKNKPIDQVLEILRLTSQFEYEIDIKENQMSIITIK